MKKIIGIFLSLTILLTASAALAAAPAKSLNYKTIFKNDDFYLAVKTDSVAWVTQPGGDVVLSLTARWGYARPARAARYYPAAGPNVNWRISKVALQFERDTGFVKVLELETTLYNASGEVVKVIKNPDTAVWRILTPSDPDYESFDKILNILTYLYDSGE